MCGSWLACDSITQELLKDRVACIAGKPAPTQARSHIGFVLLQATGYLPPVICATNAACPFASSPREIAWITSM